MTVTVTVPAGALVLAVSVNVLVVEVAPGLKEAVIPVGAFGTDRFTLPLNPFCGWTEMVLVTLVPATIVKVAGDAASVKLGGVVIVTLTEAVLVRVPDVPVTITLIVPVAALLVALKVKVLVPVVLAGLKTAVTPEGSAE